jgi:ubiquinone/menaquinone biosynthesis C-methylase UbiE
LNNETTDGGRMNKNIFVCPKCRKILNNLPPNICNECRYPKNENQNICIFSEDENLKIDGEKQYIGFDTMAKDYDRTRHIIKDLENVVSKNVAENIQNKGILVDIGAGTGIFSIALSKYFENIISVDISSEMLEICAGKIRNQKIGNILPCKINVYDLPFIENSIDAVFAVNIFHLLNKPEEVVYEIKRVLCNHGKLITIYYNGIDNTENDINNEIEEIYYDEVKKRNIGKIKTNTWRGPKLHEELMKYFASSKSIKSDNMKFSMKLTPKYEYENFRTKQYPLQMLIKNEHHNEIMKRINDTMISKYGINYLDIEIENKMDVEIKIYSKQRI